MMCKLLRLLPALALSLMAATLARAQAGPDSAKTPAAEPSPSVADPLVRVLMAKGLLTAEEGRSVSAAATPAERRDRLASLLRDKGLISPAEYEAVRVVTPIASATSTRLMPLPAKAHRLAPYSLLSSKHELLHSTC
jgi:hypothetical protein